MQIAMIGLGRMGANMVRRLMDGGHDCVVHDVAEEPIAELEAVGASGARTLEAVIAALERPRHVWIMVPAAFVGSTIDRLAPLMESDDTIIDGGNSWYRDDVDRAERMRAGFGINYLDVGTSGGIHGLERGYCLMVGGDTTAVDRMASIFDTLAPGFDAAERTPGRSGDPSTPERGWLHCGPSGAGHFVKMVHNGIEYGLMASFAEGFNVLAKAGIGRDDHPADAETAPLADAKYYRYDLDLGVDRRSVATRQCGVELAARPDGRGTGRRSEARAVRRQRERLRRGSLDDPRRGRRGRTGAGAVDRALRTFQFARQSRRRRQDPVGDAGRFRRSSRKEEFLTMSMLSMSHQPRADALVLFGATGDLAKRKLFPALYDLERLGKLDIPVIGVARSDWTDETFRKNAGKRSSAPSRTPTSRRSSH